MECANACYKYLARDCPRVVRVRGVSTRVENYFSRRGDGANDVADSAFSIGNCICGALSLSSVNGINDRVRSRNRLFFACAQAISHTACNRIRRGNVSVVARWHHRGRWRKLCGNCARRTITISSDLSTLSHIRAGHAVVFRRIDASQSFRVDVYTVRRRRGHGAARKPVLPAVCAIIRACLFSIATIKTYGAIKQLTAK